MADEDELSALSRANSLASLPRTPLPGPTTVVPVDTYVTLSNGVKMPTIGLGTFQVKKEECYKVVLYSLRVGYRHIDTAKVYKNENVIGRAIKDSRIDRKELFITSKLSPADHGVNAREAFLESLDELGLDYLDLYLIHWPAAQGIPMTSEQNIAKRRESWKALEALYEEGKVRAIGVSNYTIKHLENLMEYARIKPHVNQVEFHPQCQQKELIEYCKKHGIQVVGYSPLGQGRLLDHEDVLKVARRRNISPAPLLLRWALRKNIPIIVKTTKANRLIENLKTFENEITQQEIEMLDALDANVHYCWDPSGIP